MLCRRGALAFRRLARYKTLREESSPRWELREVSGKQGSGKVSRCFGIRLPYIFFRTNVLEQSQVVFPLRDVQRNSSRQASHTGAGDSTEQVTDRQGPSRKSRLRGETALTAAVPSNKTETGQRAPQRRPTLATHSWRPVGRGALVTWHHIKMQILIQKARCAPGNL